MKRIVFILSCLPLMALSQKNQLTPEIAEKLTQLPLHCINQEFPNKTAHIINNLDEAKMSPKELHPAFYGCFDWHSSVHGHWMLVKLLSKFPQMNNAKEIETILDQSFQKDKLQTEADYFTKFQNSATFERTYGWAWLLKLDEELYRSTYPKAKIWRENLKPLTQKIQQAWVEFLPKQTYPNRTGVHPNSAFAMSFAMDWAKTTGNKTFEKQIIEKAKNFYSEDIKIPAYLEPNGSDFFSPSLETAHLMSKILNEKEFTQWLNLYYDKKSIENLSKMPVVSDLNDFQIVHLVGLSFSRAWNMKAISKKLPQQHSLKKIFDKKAEEFLDNALPLVFQGNYGGSHWLASFAVYALED